MRAAGTNEEEEAAQVPKEGVVTATVETGALTMQPPESAQASSVMSQSTPAPPAKPLFRLRRRRVLPAPTASVTATFCTGAGVTNAVSCAPEVPPETNPVVDASKAVAVRVSPSAARRRRSASLLTCIATPAAEWIARAAPRAAWIATRRELCAICATVGRLTNRVR